MAKPVPVVNRQLSEALKKEEHRQAVRVKKQKTRLREIVGGAGLKLYFEEPAEPLTRREKRGAGKKLRKDPLIEESKRVTQRRLRKERARSLVEILFFHLARYELAGRKKLVRVPPLMPSVEWLRGQTEEELMDALLAELCGLCRVENVMRIHMHLCRMRTQRERTDLLSTFFKPEALSPTRRVAYVIERGANGATPAAAWAKERGLGLYDGQRKAAARGSKASVEVTKGRRYVYEKP